MRLHDESSILDNLVSCFRMLFWTEIGQVPGIGRAHMDGTYGEYIVSRDVIAPNGLAIDYEGYFPSLLIVVIRYIDT